MTNAPDLRLVPPEEPEAPDPWIGKTLDGRYLIEDMLGKGGMGLVYKAKHAILGKRLAVKVLKEEVSRDEKVMARFRREAQSASAIGSPHICDVSDFGTMPDGSTYFVMEFLDGPSLATAMETERPMSTQRVCDISAQLCDALGAAHERGIVHRDLKPDNIHLVAAGGRKDFVKVLDFGIAKVGDNADKKLTQAGQVFGTPHYMSPEQCAGREVDHRTDIYAIGVMLYEMVCGQVPFDSDNLMGVLTKHVYENPIPPREFPPPVDVPAGLEAIILKALAKSPDHRYQTMAEFKEDLVLCGQGGTPHAVMEGLGGVSGSTQVLNADALPHLATAVPGTPAPAGADDDGGKLPIALMAVGLVVLLMLGAGVFGLAFFLAGSDDAEPTASADPPPIADSPEVETPPASDDPAAGATGDEAPASDTRPAEPEVVHVMLRSDPDGAEVYAQDGSLMGNTPIEVQRPDDGAEPVQLTLRMPGYDAREIPISHLTTDHLTIRLDRHRRAVRNRRRATPRQPVTPQVRRLGGGGSTPTPSRPPPSSSGSSEIISPW